MLAIANGNSFCMGTLDDPAAMSLPWLFRVHVPSLMNGWAAC